MTSLWTRLSRSRGRLLLFCISITLPPAYYFRATSMALLGLVRPQLRWYLADIG